MIDKEKSNTQPQHEAQDIWKKKWDRFDEPPYREEREYEEGVSQQQ